MEAGALWPARLSAGVRIDMSERRSRLREILFLLLLIPNAALSAWLAFRLSISLGRPILVKPETPAYVLGILAFGAVCFGGAMVVSARLVGLRFVRKGGQIVLTTDPVAGAKD